jgi:hypothetical protein
MAHVGHNARAWHHARWHGSDHISPAAAAPCEPAVLIPRVGIARGIPLHFVSPRSRPLLPLSPLLLLDSSPLCSRVVSRVFAGDRHEPFKQSLWLTSRPDSISYFQSFSIILLWNSNWCPYWCPKFTKDCMLIVWNTRRNFTFWTNFKISLDCML